MVICEVGKRGKGNTCALEWFGEVVWGKWVSEFEIVMGSIGWIIKYFK